MVCVEEHKAHCEKCHIDGMSLQKKKGGERERERSYFSTHVELCVGLEVEMRTSSLCH